MNKSGRRTLKDRVVRHRQSGRPVIISQHAAETILSYLWDAEKADYEACLADDMEKPPNGHIFEALVILNEAAGRPMGKP